MDLKHIDPELIIESISRKLSIPKEYVTVKKVWRNDYKWNVSFDGYELNRWWDINHILFKHYDNWNLSESKFLESIDISTNNFLNGLEITLSPVKTITPTKEPFGTSNIETCDTTQLIKRLQFLYKLDLLEGENV